MRRRMHPRVAALLAPLLAAGVTAIGAPPEPGLRIPHERAIASFQKSTGDENCLLESFFLVLYEPSYQQLAPGGGPSAVQPFFSAIYIRDNSCSGGYVHQEWLGERGLKTSEYSFERMKSASLGPLTFMLNGSNGEADAEFELELYWVGEGHPRPVTAHSTGPRGEEFEVGIYAEAAVTGWVTGPDSETEFTAGEDTWGEIGHFNRVSPPSPVCGPPQ